MSVTASVELITPAMAEKWLNDNLSGQRPLSDHCVDDLMESIKRREWQLNGESIIFGLSGKLLNGQHRLTAIVLSGISVHSVVVRGVEDSAFATIDRGKKRSTGDLLHMSGITNYNAVAAATSLLWRYAMATMQDGYRRPTGVQVVAAVNSLPLIQDIVARVYSVPAIKTLCGQSVTAASFTLFTIADPDQFAEFERLLSGDKAMDNSSPVYRLRERLQDNRANKAKLRQDDLFAIFIRAWEYFTNGRRGVLLRWSKEQAFPIVTGCKPERLRKMMGISQ